MDYASMGVMAITLFSDIMGGKAKKSQSDYQAGVYDANQAIARMQVEDTLARGRLLESQSRFNTRKVIGSQRAVMGAQGQDLESGSALDVQADTAGLGELDALTIRNNAAREAWGYQVEAYNYGLKSTAATQAGKNELMTSILTGGAKALQFYTLATDKSGGGTQKGVSSGRDRSYGGGG